MAINQLVADFQEKISLPNKPNFPFEAYILSIICLHSFFKLFIPVHHFTFSTNYRMLKGILTLIAMVYASIGFSQHLFRAIIKDAENKQILPGATAIIKGTVLFSGYPVHGFFSIHSIFS